MNPNEPLSIFFIGGVGTRLFFYFNGDLKQNKDLDQSKQTI
jgi:hypothetical protein